jgi:hypothetical protein
MGHRIEGEATAVGLTALEHRAALGKIVSPTFC